MGRKKSIIRNTESDKIITAAKKKNGVSSNKSDKIIPERKIYGKFIVWLSLALLFIISAIYFYWFSNGLLFYQENRSLFIFSGEYLQKFASEPGGLLEYAGNFLAQGYFNTIYGALLISSLLILPGIILINISKRLSAYKSFSLLLILFPSCILLLVQTNYDHFIHNNLGYLFVMLWFLISILPEKKHIRFFILVLFPVFFYLAGCFALVYLGMYIVYVIIYEKGRLRYFLPASMLLYAFLIYVVFKNLIFLQPGDQLLRYPLPFINISKVPALLSILGVFVIFFPLFVKISELFTKKKYANIIPFATMLTVLPITVLLLCRKYDPDLENLVQLEKAVSNQDWNLVIRQHENFPSTNVIGQYYYNLALSEKDQLCDRLFFGRQDFGAKALTLPRDNAHINRAVHFYYTVGLISEAHHLAYESMVGFGYRPENIKLLIKTELIDGNYKIAERYINVLKKTLHYRNWAAKYEKMLNNHALVYSDPELGEKIRMLPKRDFFLGPDDAQNIGLIVAANPNNKRAFEYKMARFLLDKNYKAVVNEVKKMGAMGYTSIPRHIEEAVVGFENLTNESPDLGGLFVSPETEARFFQYGTLYNQNSGHKSLLEKAMKKAAGNTFWYYLQF
ncbi:MAG: DUF6057 family protein [Bacteroidales bacterium]|nr:DUF6057 family protein [Bacteroidales bacterium]